MPKTLCFDMYGTLCDTSSVSETLGRELDASADLVAAIDETWRRKQLQYSFLRGLMDDYTTFWEVTSDALDHALDRYGTDASSATRDAILDAYNHLDPYPTARDTLVELRETGYTVAVLSNGNPEMLERLAESAGLADALDDIVSADEVKTFKPSPAVYENAAARTDTALGDCCLVSGNAWDVAGAGAAGMQTAWVNRGRNPVERVGPDPTYTVSSLDTLPERLG